jgi:hypothetical protein
MRMDRNRKTFFLVNAEEGGNVTVVRKNGRETDEADVVARLLRKDVVVVYAFTHPRRRFKHVFGVSFAMEPRGKKKSPSSCMYSLPPCRAVDNFLLRK